jgi:two-component system phosphate regulon response regulator PhoB
MRVSSERTKPRILVVDDDLALQRLVATLLERAEMEPVQAMNASEAAGILRTPPLPALVILDMMLPEISGIEFLKQMRSRNVYDDLPVVILSALADPAQIREGLDAGADRYLTKPYLANNLIRTVQEILKTGRVRREGGS